jgi:hypothetical protein
MTRLISTNETANNNVLGLPEFQPAALETTDTTRPVEHAAAALSLNTLIEPFGTDLAIGAETMANKPKPNTGGPSNPKDGGLYDDYKTADE